MPLATLLRKAALDTSAVLELGDPTAAHHADVLDGLRALKGHGFRIHLADGTVVELLNQLAEHRLSWATWLRTRRLLTRLLDATQPVLLGGWEILASAGIVLDGGSRTVPDSDPDIRAGWKRAIKARTYSELWEPRHHRSAGKWVLGATSRDAARTTVREEKADWTAGLDRVLADANQQGISDIKADDFLKLVSSVSAGIDSRSAPVDGVPASVRFDAMIRVYARFSRMRLQSRGPYNPIKRGNDAFDHDLLRYLALPALVCTCDTQTLVAAVEDSQSWQRRWILGPAELRSIANGSAPPDLSWPATNKPHGPP